MTTGPRRSDVIVVLGMHRAGTSLCGRILQELGVDFGSALLSPRADNPEGLYEHPGIIGPSKAINALLNRRVVSPTGALPFPQGWQELPDLQEHKRALVRVLLDEMSRTGAIFAFKDPNTVRILPLWQAIFAEHGINPRYVVTVRAPRPVARSLARRDQITLAQGELLWAVHYADAIRYLDGHLGCAVSFDGWFERPHEQLAQLAKVVGASLELPALAAGLASLVRPDLRHHDVRERGENALAERIHEALIDAVQRDIDPAALLASIEPLDQAMKALDPVAGALEQLSSGNVRRVLRRFETAGWVPREWPPAMIVPKETPRRGGARQSLRVGIVMPSGELATAASPLSHEDRGFLELALALAADGHAVSVFFIERDPARAAASEYIARGRSLPGRIGLSSIEEGPVPCSLPGGTGFVGKAARIAYIAYEELKSADLDVLHVPDYKAPAFFVLCAKQAGLDFQRTVVCLHLVRPYYLALRQEQRLVSDATHVIWNAMEDYCASGADYVASATGFLFRGLLERGVPRRGNRVYLRLALPVPPPRGPRDLALAPPRRLFFLGPLTMRGGVQLFCDALKRLHASGTRPVELPATVAFMSEEQTSAEVAAVRAALGGLETGLEFFACPAPADRAAHLRDPHAVFVAVSPWEARNDLALECVHAGGRVLLSSSGGTAELLTQADAVVVKPHPHDIAEAVLRSCRGELPRSSIRVEVERAGEEWARWHQSLQFGAESNRDLAAAMREQALAAVRRHGGEDWQEHAGRYDERGALAEAPSVDELIHDVERSIALRERLAAAMPAGGDWPGPGEPPLVSVVLAHYERPALVVQAIRSIAAQWYPSLELILVDDGSRDPRTRDFLDRLDGPFGRVGWQVLRNPNLSPGASRNRGVQAAAGSYVLCMDDDNVAKPHELAVLVRAALHGDADVVTCFRDSFEGEAPPWTGTALSRIVALGGLPSIAPLVNALGDANVLVRRNTYLRAGGYLEDHRTGKEDYEFLVRLLMAGSAFAVVPEALFWYRQLTVRRRNFHYSPVSGYLTVMAAFERQVPAPFRDLLSYARAIQSEIAPDSSDLPAQKAADGDLAKLFSVYDIRNDELVLRIGHAAWEAGSRASMALAVIQGDGSVTEVSFPDPDRITSCPSQVPDVYRVRLSPGEGERIMAGDFEVHLVVRFPNGERSSTPLVRQEGYQGSARRFSGVCERIQQGVARGWVFDQQKLNWAVPLVAYLDDAFLGSYVPVVPRLDLQRHYSVTVARGEVVEREVPGRGFEIPIPLELLGGARSPSTLEIRVAFTPYHLRRTPVHGLAGSMSWDRDKTVWAPAA